MAAESPTHLELEIGHVLFMDVVAYGNSLKSSEVPSTFVPPKQLASLLNASSLLGHSRVPMICEMEKELVTRGTQRFGHPSTKGSSDYLGLTRST